jgi:BASS family bile acid:Na+ symporter
MSLAAAIQTVLLASMLLLVFALGARSSAGDGAYLFKQPNLLVRSLLAMNVLMPLLIVVFVMNADLRPAVKIALVALAVSPVPPFLPSKQLKLVSQDAYVYGLLVAASLLAIVLVPLSMELITSRLGIATRITATEVLRVVALTVLLPLGAGMIVRRYWPAAAGRIGPVANKAGGVLLLIALAPVLIAQWPTLVSLTGDGTLLAAVVFTAIGLFVGHLLGGPNPDNRTVLALATASRHPAVAIAIANAAFPTEKLAPAAVVLVLLVNLLAAAPYTAWRKRMHVLGGRHA